MKKKNNFLCFPTTLLCTYVLSCSHFQPLSWPVILFLWYWHLSHGFPHGRKSLPYSTTEPHPQPPNGILRKLNPLIHSHFINFHTHFYRQFIQHFVWYIPRYLVFLFSYNYYLKFLLGMVVCAYNLSTQKAKVFQGQPGLHW